MADYTQTAVGRASAILTTGEVAGAALPLERVKDKRVTVIFNFTVGSLTNGIIRFYVSRDNSTYFPLYLGGTAMTETLTADGTRCYALPPMTGWKWFRATLQGTDTVTGSAGAFRYFWERLGAP